MDSEPQGRIYDVCTGSARAQQVKTHARLGTSFQPLEDTIDLETSPKSEYNSRNFNSTLAFCWEIVSFIP